MNKELNKLLNLELNLAREMLDQLLKENDQMESISYEQAEQITHTEGFIYGLTRSLELINLLNNK